MPHPWRPPAVRRHSPRGWWLSRAPSRPPRTWRRRPGAQPPPDLDRAPLAGCSRCGPSPRCCLSSMPAPSVMLLMRRCSSSQPQPAWPAARSPSTTAVPSWQCGVGSGSGHAVLCQQHAREQAHDAAARALPPSPHERAPTSDPPTQPTSQREKAPTCPCLVGSF